MSLTIIKAVFEQVSFSFSSLSGVEYVALNTNLPATPGVVRFFDAVGFNKLFEWKNQNPLNVPRSFFDTPKKVLFFPYDSSGIWVNDAFTYTEGVTALNFTEPPGAEVDPSHTLSGTLLRDGQPYAGEVHIVSATEQKHLAAVMASPSTGQWSANIGTSAAVYAFVYAPYGREYSEGLAVSVGDVIHPPAANGYTYTVTVAGALGPAPTEWVNDKPFATGTAVLDPAPYPAPQIHGPITPDPINP
ncbi:MAG: hypothetical protein CMB99_16185 [Flavobacteriaceae bacterium]|nr:hypothetical protein [Flavobacteriaceae bacterium]|tara:strand:- start:20535 stop:21269 length:735 start_codon:yes stop_codon:yes gene_type:complete